MTESTGSSGTSGKQVETVSIDARQGEKGKQRGCNGERQRKIERERWRE